MSDERFNSHQQRQIRRMEQAESEDRRANQVGYRTLTDADLEALSNKVVEKMENKFYSRLGRAVWGALIGFVLVLFGWEKFGPK